jgi:cytochrome c-type biogenesis protein CcmH
MLAMPHALRSAALALLVAWPMAAGAVQPDEILADPALEARARQISAELRCLVCQNQSIDDSNAPLARDLRVLVRERLKSGDSDAAVRDYVVARYGAFVLLRPPLQMSTLLLWATPLLLLGTTLLIISSRLRSARTATHAQAPPLTPEERARLARLLQADRE